MAVTRSAWKIWLRDWALRKSKPPKDDIEARLVAELKGKLLLDNSCFINLSYARADSYFRGLPIYLSGPGINLSTAAILLPSYF